MKAIFYREFGARSVLEFGDQPDPLPKNGELLIDVHRTSVNFVDIRERQGTYNKPETHGGHVALPHISGLQATGVVVAAGSDADRGWVGKKVLAYTPAGGGYAQRVVAQTQFCTPIPETPDEGAFAALPNQGLTVYLLLTASTQVRPGEAILIQGASGGVGSLAIQIARTMGAGVVIGTASSDEKLQLIRSLGATHAIDYTKEDWTQKVLDATNGRGVDIILESVGGDIFEKNFDCLAPFGRYILYGSTRGPGQPLAPRRLMGKAQTLTGFYLPVFLQKPELIHAGLHYLVHAAAHGTLKPVIDRTLPLREAAEAHRLLEDREVRGTILLDTTL
jgi:NADPH2:quinone reductase